MTANNDSAAHTQQRQRVPRPIWVALGVAVMLALVSMLAIGHRSGVPTLTPGQAGSVHTSSSL